MDNLIKNLWEKHPTYLVSLLLLLNGGLSGASSYFGKYSAFENRLAQIEKRTGEIKEKQNGQEKDIALIKLELQLAKEQKKWQTPEEKSAIAEAQAQKVVKKELREFEDRLIKYIKALTDGKKNTPTKD